MYRVSIKKSVCKELKEIPKGPLKKIIHHLEALSSTPRPPGCKKLASSQKALWRVRSGTYRIVYTVNDREKLVEIRRVGHRRDVYS